MKSLSSIVKANKWVIQEKKFSSKKSGGEKNEQGMLLDENLESVDDVLENALKSAEAIKLKFQEEGYQEGLSKGYEIGLHQGEEEGFRLGLERGEEQGQQEGVQTVKAEGALKLKEFQRAIEVLDEERQLLLKNQEKEIMAVAFEIAKKIMKQQVQEEENFLKIFDDVIYDEEEEVKIYLSENQKTLNFRVSQVIAEKLKKLSKRTKVITLKEDDKIMVETNNSVIDMSLPVQLNQLEKAIEDSF